MKNLEDMFQWADRLIFDKTGENFTEYYQTIQARLQGLPCTVLVLAAPDFAFEKVLTDATTGS
jgi:hypothetical protein